MTILHDKAKTSTKIMNNMTKKKPQNKEGIICIILQLLRQLCKRNYTWKSSTGTSMSWVTVYLPYPNTIPMWVDFIMSLRIVTAIYSLILTKGNVWVVRKRLYNSKRSFHHLQVENPIVPHLTLDKNSGKDGLLKSQNNSHLSRLIWSQKLGSWNVKGYKRESKEDRVPMNVKSLRFRSRR